MSAKIRPKEETAGGLSQLSGAITGALRGWIGIVVAVVALGGAGWGATLLWQRVRPHVLAQDDYRLDAQEIQITPTPPWIRADVRGEALRNAGLTGNLSILDDDLIERIHKAFQLQPWVAKVGRVSKRHPAHVDVELVYRRPVAMVEVPGGWYAIDVDAVLLPSDDFSRADTRTYPWLAGVESTPLGTGAAWGDPVVAGGARIADGLAATWSELRLRSIHWVKPAAGANPALPASYDLLTGTGTKIHWGAAPGSEPSGEPSLEAKVARLKALITQFGDLDTAAATTSLDLRQPQPPATPRTAAR
jgi:hypothetical protein